MVDDLSVAIVTAITRGLAYLHSNAIIHGRLSAQSCRLDQNYNIKQTDWEGIFYLERLGRFPRAIRRSIFAKVFPEKLPTVNSESSVTLGFENEAADWRSDIHNLGLVFWEIITADEDQQEAIHSSASLEEKDSEKVSKCATTYDSHVYFNTLTLQMTVCWQNHT